MRKRGRMSAVSSTFDNQNIKYTDKVNETCPAMDKACVSFDTGLIDAKYPWD